MQTRRLFVRIGATGIPVGELIVDKPVRRAISRIEKWSRYRQRRMTLNNSMSITPKPPAVAQGVGSNMGQFSVEIPVLPGSDLSGNQQTEQSSNRSVGPDACPSQIVLASRGRGRRHSTARPTI